MKLWLLRIGLLPVGVVLAVAIEAILFFGWPLAIYAIIIFSTHKGMKIAWDERETSTVFILATVSLLLYVLFAALLAYDAHWAYVLGSAAISIGVNLYFWITFVEAERSTS